MNSAVLILPLFIIRYGMLALINKKSIAKAAYFPPTEGAEVPMFWIYQASTVLIIAALAFQKIINEAPWVVIGAIVYGLGVVLLAFATLSFAKPGENGVNETGLYRFSRNPMYVAYFLYFLGCVFLTQSLVLMGLLCSFQLSAHWIILAEERWCKKTFGEPYLAYCRKVRRYI